MSILNFTRGIRTTLVDSLDWGQGAGPDRSCIDDDDESRGIPWRLEFPDPLWERQLAIDDDDESNHSSIIL